MANKLLYSEPVNTGLFILRLGIGAAFILHGYPKLFLGGADKLADGLAKIPAIPYPTVAAYLAAAAEFFGGIALIIGILFRPTALVMLFTMAVAVFVHIKSGQGGYLPTKNPGYSHALESAIIFFALLISGPGKFSLDSLIFGKKSEPKIE